MAQISYEDVAMQPENGNSSTNSNSVGFFKLSKDGEEAIVRIICDDIKDLEILTVHGIQLNGKFRQVNCIRDPREPLEQCPLCAANEKVNQSCFIRLIHYYPEYDVSGNLVKVTPKAEIWQRSASGYAPKIKSFLDNYGPLSNIMCKIVRHGAAGDQKTTYDIIPNLSPTNFPETVYPKQVELFEGYKVLGRAVMDKNFVELNQYVATGNFPAPSNTEAAPQPYTPAPTAPVGQVPTPQPIPNGAVNPYSTLEPSTQMERPTRFYG